MFHRTLSALAVTLVGALLIAVGGAGPALGADAAASRVGPQHSGVVSPSGEAAPSFLSLRPGGTVLAPGQSMTFEALYDTRPADSSDVIWESSDTSVFTVDGNGLVTAVDLSKAAMRRIRTDFGLIMTLNTVFLASGLAGFLQPGPSALLHNLTTVGVSLNAMRPMLKAGAELQLEEVSA
mgnify:CR=1 FL=1